MAEADECCDLHLIGIFVRVAEVVWRHSTDPFEPKESGG